MLTLIVQHSRICGQVVFVAYKCERGPLLKCRGDLHRRCCGSWRRMSRVGAYMVDGDGPVRAA